MSAKKYHVDHKRVKSHRHTRPCKIWQTKEYSCLPVAAGALITRSNCSRPSGTNKEFHTQGFLLFLLASIRQMHETCSDHRIRFLSTRTVNSRQALDLSRQRRVLQAAPMPFRSHSSAIPRPHLSIDQSKNKEAGRGSFLS